MVSLLCAGPGNMSNVGKSTSKVMKFLVSQAGAHLACRQDCIVSIAPVIFPLVQLQDHENSPEHKDAQKAFIVAAGRHA